MSGQYILDTDGQPFPEPSVLAWGRWMATANRTVERDEIDGVTVSTVFLGLDVPILWETMIFGGPHDQYQERYTSKADAVEGHKRALALARGAAHD